MKITLDHNCIIHLKDCTDIGLDIKTIIEDSANECFVVNIGASEMRERGIKPENYDLFEELLKEAQINHLPRLNPLFIFDITFWDKCIWAGEEDIQLVQEIESILFGNSPDINIEQEQADNSAAKKSLNRLCDAQTMWCHIQNKNDIFLTADRNFMKETKLPRLIELGARKICHPTRFREALN